MGAAASICVLVVERKKQAECPESDVAEVPEDSTGGQSVDAAIIGR